MRSVESNGLFAAVESPRGKRWSKESAFDIIPGNAGPDPAVSILDSEREAEGAMNLGPPSKAQKLLPEQPGMKGGGLL